MYKLHLILKYLLKRRIAWVSLLAVTLCTAMVLVVISVMGGWLRMFRQSFHGLTGDIVVEGRSMTGFAHYQEMIDRIEGLEEVESAVPTISTYGLINIAGIETNMVQVIGFDIGRIGQVNNFPQSLYRQHTSLLDQAKGEDVSPERAELLRKLAAAPPTFDLRTYAGVPADAVPELLWEALEGRFEGRLRENPDRGLLVYEGRMRGKERDELLGLSDDSMYQEAVRLLYDRSHTEVLDYESLLPDAPRSVTTWPGLIAGAGVLRIRKGPDGSIVNRHEGLYELTAKLTVMGISPRSIVGGTGDNPVPRSFWIVDDSRTGLFQYDQNTVYVPFDTLQTVLGMREKKGVDQYTKKPKVTPARVTDIHVSLKDGADLLAAKERIQGEVDAVLEGHEQQLGVPPPLVETWEEDKATYLTAIENETLLVTFLFGIISLVAVFLIFCIFYMIVVEKTRDIGIIKSVGATSGGVAGIFLGYGMAIGIVGGGLGLLAAFLITRYINEIHNWLGARLGLQIWNPEVYLFDRIPNTMDPKAVAIIVVCAVVASVFGALVPALRAARMHPVEALRWE